LKELKIAGLGITKQPQINNGKSQDWREEDAMNSVHNKGPTQIVLFSLDEPRYALELTVVERVVRSVEITPLPGAPEIVLGVINLQGRIIPVVNIRKRFNLPWHEPGLADRFIVAHTSMRQIAVVVDSVIGVQLIKDIEPAGTGQTLPTASCVQGAAKVDRDIVLIFDLNRFLSLDEEEKLSASLQGGAI
jgi:purine-binding chemotaxis protein CheW